MSRAALRPSSRLPAVDRPPASRPRLGYLLLLSVPVAIGLVPIRDLEVAGFNHVLFVFGLFFVAGGFAVLSEAALTKDLRSIRVFRPWMVWFAYIWLSLLWCERLESHNIAFAMHLTMPLPIGALGILMVRTREQLRLLIRAFAVGLALLALLAVGASSGLLPALGFEVDNRPLAIGAAMAACVFVAGIDRRPLVAVTGWLLAAAAAALTGGRMAVAVILVLPMIAPVYRNLPKRCVVLALIVVVGAGLFFLTPLHERFAGGQVSTLGRLDAWPLILEEAGQRPLLGAGVDASADFVPTIWPRMDAPHNEYLRIGYEFGLIGLVIFLSVVIWQLIALKRRMDRTDGLVRQAFAACLLGLVVLLITACTDNPIGYSLMFLNPLFALMGAAYGVSRYEAERSQGRSEPLPDGGGRHPDRSRPDGRSGA